MWTIRLMWALATGLGLALRALVVAAALAPVILLARCVVG